MKNQIKVAINAENRFAASEQIEAVMKCAGGYFESVRVIGKIIIKNDGRAGFIMLAESSGESYNAAYSKFRDEMSKRKRYVL